MERKKGFTLIELLVVVSIISLLSSVVIASLGNARNRAADNAVKAVMKQMLTQGQNYRNTVAESVGFGANINSVPAAGSVCAGGVFTDSQFEAMQRNVLANAAPGAVLRCTTNSAATSWSVRVDYLRGGGSWCVDNTSDFNASASNASGECVLP